MAIDAVIYGVIFTLCLLVTYAAIREVNRETPRLLVLDLGSLFGMFLWWTTSFLSFDVITLSGDHVTLESLGLLAAAAGFVCLGLFVKAMLDEEFRDALKDEGGAGRTSYRRGSARGRR